MMRLHVESSGLYGRAVIDLALKDRSRIRRGKAGCKSLRSSSAQSGVPVYADRQSELIPEAWPLPDTIFYYGWYTQDVDGALKSECLSSSSGGRSPVTCTRSARARCGARTSTG
jgi:hypothetical protein